MRATLPRISSAVAVQLKGRARSLWLATKASMRATSPLALVNEPRRISRWLRRPNQRAIRFEPRSVGGGAVDVEAGPLGQPGPDLGVLVGTVVVDHEMDVERGRQRCVHVPEEGQELLVAVAGLALGQDLAVGDIERGEQRRGAMALVIVRDAVDVAEPHGQDGPGALERLDLVLSSTPSTTVWSGGFR